MSIPLHILDPFTEARYLQFLRFFRADSRLILDVGCCTGQGGAVLVRKDRSLEVHGLDCVGEHHDKLSCTYALGICGRASAIPVSDGIYDVVLAGEIIEHLRDDEVDRSLAEIHRVLKAGGLLLLTTPHTSSFSHRLLKQRVFDDGHLSEHFPKPLRRRLLQYGFDNVLCFGTGRMSRFLGMRFPLLKMYGSFMMKAEKPREQLS
jgi:SAM-dependent methyltransferase